MLIDHAGIAALIPHQGAMCLLDAVESWSDVEIVCGAASHLDPGNPLRRDGRLGTVCAVEYGLQAAALHGALAAGGVAQPAGFLAVLRDLTLDAPRLDDPGLGRLRVTAGLERREGAGLLYSFAVTGSRGQRVVGGRAAIALPV